MAGNGARATVGGTAPERAAGRSRRRHWGRWLVVIAAIVLVVAVAIVGAVGWVASERAIHPAPNTYPWSLADYPNLKAEPVTFRSSTGVTIAGRFIPGASKATIILSHGYGDNQNQMLPWADFLNRSGFSVFTYDMRARGASGGRDVTLGALEQFDLVSAVEYLATRPDVDPNRIGALGVSLGGSTTILAAARDARIKAVVDDCGFSDAPDVISTSFEHFIGIPAWPFAPVAVRIAEWRAGVDVNGVRPMDVIGSISPRPIFIIHGTVDQDVPPDNGVRNYDAARQPKQIWWVAGAGHNQSREVAGAAYGQRINAFFHQALGV